MKAESLEDDVAERVLAEILRTKNAAKVTAAVQVPIGEEAPLAGVPNLALRAERAANLVGAQLLGYSADWPSALRDLATAGLVIL